MSLPVELPRATARSALFAVAAAALLLLLVGTRNAWDMVMYNVFVKRRQRGEDEREH